MIDSKTAALAIERGIKYLHPHASPSQTWTGKGQRPKWVEQVLAENKDATLESLEVGHKNYGAFIPAPVVPAITVLDKFDTGSVKKALAATKASGGTEGTFYNVPHKLLRVDPAFNIRDHSEEYLRHRKWLRDQIIDNGYDRTKPMTGYVVKNPETQVDEFFLTDGFTRHGAIDDAIKAGKLPEDFIVPVMQPNAGASKEDMTVSLFTANTGRQLTPMELARIFQRLMGYGWDDKRIATRFDFTVPYIRDMMTLLTMPPSIREKVSAGKLSATEAIKTVKVMGGNKAAKVIDEAAVKAKAAGKTKITAKHISTDRPKRPAKLLAATGSPTNPDGTLRDQAQVEMKLDVKDIADKLTFDRTEEIKEKIRDAIVLALIEPHKLIAEMMVYIDEVKLPTDEDAVALIVRAKAMIAVDEIPQPAADNKPAADAAPVDDEI